MLKKIKKFLQKREELRNKRATLKLIELRNRFYAFKNLLIINNDLLERLTKLDAKLRQSRDFFPGVRSAYSKIHQLTKDLIHDLNKLSGNKFPDLQRVNEKIYSQISKSLLELDTDEYSPIILSIKEANPELIHLVGGKAAHLGELKEFEIPIPDGFIITTAACEQFFDANNLSNEIRRALHSTKANEFKQINELAERIKSMIMRSLIPETIRIQMDQHFNSFLRKMNDDFIQGFAIRSSGIPEDGKFSFAGQFSTVLNVSTETQFHKAYKQVVASNFTSESIVYRLQHQIGFQDIYMAVLCLPMIDARSAGTLYTIDPNDLEAERLIISSVWGLGEYTVNGRIPSDIFHVSRLNTDWFETVHLAKKEIKLACNLMNGGVTEKPVKKEDFFSFSLSEDEIKKLCEYSLSIEKYLGTPQDIEWALNSQGKIFILQSRELQLPEKKSLFYELLPSEDKKLFEGGFAASSGVAAGKVFPIQDEAELDKVPEDSILIAHHSSLRMSISMQRIKGIIIETGNPLEHLACVARENHIPMLIKANGAFERLSKIDIIIMDADNGIVYEGNKEILKLFASKSLTVKEKEIINPIVTELRKSTFNLNLIDIRETKFKMYSCKSIHDIIRFCHEQAIRTMFEINRSASERYKTFATSLETLIPIEMSLINLGGGFAIQGHPKSIKPDEIVSLPFVSLWKGISHPDIKWSGPPLTFDDKGMRSVFFNTLFDKSRSEQPLGTQTYVLISREYMNLNSRLAYHFVMVDTFCSTNASENYLNFRFKGGGTAMQRRVLRIQFIVEILRHYHFFTDVQQDIINATIKDINQEDMTNIIAMIGRLLGCSRLLDMAMVDENTMKWFVDAFLKENYAFDGYENLYELI